MNVSISIGQNHHYELREALLIYRSGDTSRSDRANAFVSRHTVAKTDGLRTPILGPAQPLTLEFLQTLARELGNYAAIEVLPVNVVARTERMIAWWTAGQKRQMFFSTTQGKLAKVNGAIFPQPPLLWMVNHRGLAIRAMQQDQRPAADTKLCFAPYWNLFEAGRVCLGSMRAPNASTVAAIDLWEQGFYESAFTHGNVGRVTRHRGGFEGLWKELAGKEIFPADSLVELAETVGDFLQGKERDHAD
jgi:PRTRC genetic system protein B